MTEIIVLTVYVLMIIAITWMAVDGGHLTELVILVLFASALLTPLAMMDPNGLEFMKMTFWDCPNRIVALTLGAW